MADDEKPEQPMIPPEDMQNGLRFMHLLGAQTSNQLSDLSASFYALLETMIASGAIAVDDYEKRRQLTLAREGERGAQRAQVRLTLVPDKYALDELPQIDCEARLPLCKARCCTFVFNLSTQDLDERVVRWDYGQPYRIGRRPDGYCVHNVPGKCGCEVYANRPAICRTYDCRTDKRVWADFEKRIPAP